MICNCHRNISLLKNKATPRYSSPRSPISASVLTRQLQTQGRIPPSICSCAEPKKLLLAPVWVQKEQKSDSSSHSASPGSHFCARAARRSPAAPLAAQSTPAPRQEPLPALPIRGTFGDISTATNRGDEFESGPIEKMKVESSTLISRAPNWVLLLPRLLRANTVLKKI